MPVETQRKGTVFRLKDSESTRKAVKLRTVRWVSALKGGQNTHTRKGSASRGQVFSHRLLGEVAVLNQGADPLFVALVRDAPAERRRPYGVSPRYKSAADRGLPDGSVRGWTEGECEPAVVWPKLARYRTRSKERDKKKNKFKKYKMNDGKPGGGLCRVAVCLRIGVSVVDENPELLRVGRVLHGPGTTDGHQ